METPRDAEGQGSTTLCRGGCGFYGSPAQEGLCSKCFKDALDKKGDPARAALQGPASLAPSLGPPSASPSSPASPPPSAPILIPGATSTSTERTASESPAASPGGATSSLGASASTSALGDAVEEGATAASLPAAASVPASLAAAAKKKKNRCGAADCRVKLGLMGWDCRCGSQFCSEHRYSDQHACPFDYHSQGKEELAKSNPKVVAAKIHKI